MYFFSLGGLVVLSVYFLGGVVGVESREPAVALLGFSVAAPPRVHGRAQVVGNTNRVTFLSELFRRFGHGSSSSVGDPF